MAKFSVRFDIAEAYVIEVEADDEYAARSMVEADPQGYKKLAVYGGWDLIPDSIVNPVED